MSRVVLSGYYGFNNLGDEAVLTATVAALRDRRPGVEIAVLSRAPQATARALDVEGVSRARPADLLRALRGCDLFLSGGGSLFQDATSWRSPWYYLGVLGLARRLSRHTAIYAQGIGPLRGRAARTAARVLLNGVDLITLRDPESLATLVSLGIDRPPTVIAGDPALLLTPDPSPRVLAERSQWGDAVPFGLALRSWKNDAWSDGVATAARAIAERRGVRWICVPMQWPGDLDVADRVAARIGNGARVVRDPVGPREMLALIGHLRLLIGMRLHALIFAAIRGVPFVALTYDPKVTTFAREVGEPLLDLAGLTAEVLGRLIEGAASDLEERSARLLASVAPLRARARLAPDLVAGLLS